MTFEESSLFSADDSEEPIEIIHNETNYESFHEFQNSMNETYERVEREKTLRERATNLKIWDSEVPERWRGASLSKIDNPAAKTILDMIKDKGKSNFFIFGDPGSGKTYLAYATVRKFIGAGLTTPSRVKLLNENLLLHYASTGFEGRAKFEKALDKQYSVYIIDNLGSKDVYDQRRDIPMIEQLIEHIYSNSLLVIFTSNHSSAHFAEKLTVSGASKFKHLIADVSVKINGTRTPELFDLTDDEKNGQVEESEDERMLNAFES